MKRLIAVLFTVTSVVGGAMNVYAGVPTNDITTAVYFMNDLTNNYNGCTVYNNGNTYYDPKGLNQQRLNNLQQKNIECKNFFNFVDFL